MKLNFIFFPAPKKRYSKEQHLGELIWIPKLYYDSDNHAQSSSQSQIRVSTSPSPLVKALSQHTSPVRPQAQSSSHIRFASPPVTSTRTNKPILRSRLPSRNLAVQQQSQSALAILGNFNSQPSTRAAFLREPFKKEESIERSFLLEIDSAPSTFLQQQQKQPQTSIQSKTNQKQLSTQKQFKCPPPPPVQQPAVSRYSLSGKENQNSSSSSTNPIAKQGRQSYQSLKQRSNITSFFTLKKHQNKPVKSTKNVNCSGILENIEEENKSDALKSPKDIQNYITKSFQTLAKPTYLNTRVLTSPSESGMFTGSESIHHRVATSAAVATLTVPATEEEEEDVDDCFSDIEQEDHPHWCGNISSTNAPLTVLETNRKTPLPNSSSEAKKDGQAKMPHMLSVKSIQSFQSVSSHAIKNNPLHQPHTKESLRLNDSEENKHIPCLYLRSPIPSNYVMIYFHGNGEDISLSYEMTNHLRHALKMNILAVEYSGYGIYEGETDENQILKDTRYVYHYLTKVLKFSGSNILVMGRSIGSGPATWLAAHESVRALVLVSAFTSIRAVVKHVAGSLAQHLIQERFENSQNIKNVHCPTFIVHGQQDTLIPHSQGQTLQELCAGPCKAIFPPRMTHIELNFHNDLTNPLIEFLQANGLNIIADNSTLTPSTRITLPAYLYVEP